MSGKVVINIAADMDVHRRRNPGQQLPNSAPAEPWNAHQKGHQDEKAGKWSPKSSASRPSYRRAQGLLWACLLIFFVVPVLSGRVTLPALLGKLITVTGIVYLGYKLLTFQRWADEHKQVPRFLVCFVAMLVELTWENCMVWLVSWGDQRKYDNVPGLQDNVLLAAQRASAASPLLQRLIYGRWCNILHFLGAMLAMAFSVIWDQVPYSGFGMMSRVLLSVACSRVLRVACFMCTVLPNPIPGCYARRFPPPPDTVWATIRAGYTTIRGFGGCNDLIFSGHGAFWVLTPLMFSTYCPRHPVNWLLWLALAHASLSDVVYQQHYSVDMLLAVVVTWAVWSWLRWVYPEDQPLPPRPPGTRPDKPHPAVLALIGFALLAAGVIVIGGKA